MTNGKFIATKILQSNDNTKTTKNLYFMQLPSATHAILHRKFMNMNLTVKMIHDTATPQLIRMVPDP
jgi:hypothetical protein